MKIIEKVEISYFRSVYSLSLAKCQDVNILIGQNDAGKSNILKALNLFFNNETELTSPVEFLEDLSRSRAEEARAAKGKTTIWIKVTFRNYENWSSLPETFVVKRTWTRYSDQPETVVVGSKKKIPNTTLGRFLSKIAFHYVPAVRGRDIFSHYLTMLHDALIDDEKAGISEASTGLVTRINQSTEEMAKDIEARLGFESSIGMPRDLKHLFTALDFTTKFSHHEVPLKKRGDGIQARHIPFILSFVASQSRKNHIWGYEEPENSLEMGRAFDLADQFQAEFARNNQIFLSTHSPAFYSLDQDNVKKWLVKSCDGHDFSGKATAAFSLDSVADFDKSVGVAALISERAKELHDQIELLQVSSEELRGRLQDAETPQVIVEGPTDVTILNHVYGLLYPDQAPIFEFISAASAKKVVSFVLGVADLGREYPFPITGLLDDDHEGRSQFNVNKQNSYRSLAGTQLRTLDGVRGIYLGFLPKPDWVTAAEATLKDQGREAQLPVTIETLVSKEFMAASIAAGEISFSDEMTKAKNANFEVPVNISDELGRHLEDDDRYLVQKVDEQSKIPFSEYFQANATLQDCEAFRPIFEWLETTVQLFQQARDE
ncbi:AAA family ATPase [Marinobacter salinisoli]|uniref:AAA family ATPase n=1 Tax=Marinobacter salinisoli TaxID=2769486 RepID=A0ABX7MNK8_9GAMM|nr:AAA family ATPase [Marinobacter salinisoli]QSP93841.1 AAA family ATPase [Marinobacter salinisoli]